MNLIKKILFLALVAIVLLLISSVFIIVENKYVLLSGKWKDKVTGTEYINAGRYNLFNKKVPISYNYEVNNYTIYAAISNDLNASMEFIALDENSNKILLDIDTNHPCYSTSNHLREFGLYKDKAVYGWRHDIDMDSDWIKQNRPSCYGVEIPENLWIEISNEEASFSMKIPIEIRKAGYYIVFDSL